MVKNMVFGLALGLLMLLVIPWLLPAHYQIEREILIDSRREHIFPYVVDLSSWPQWNPIYKSEPQAQFSFSGTPGVVGSLTTWNGEKIGRGQRVLVRVIQPEYIETQLEFHRSAPAIGYWKLISEGEQTRVIWGIKGDLSYPIGRIAGLNRASDLGDRIQNGLNSLKNLIENKN